MTVIIQNLIFFKYQTGSGDDVLSLTVQQELVLSKSQRAQLTCFQQTGCSSSKLISPNHLVTKQIYPLNTFTIYLLIPVTTEINNKYWTWIPKQESVQNLSCWWALLPLKKKSRGAAKTWWKQLFLQVVLVVSSNIFFNYYWYTLLIYMYIHWSIEILINISNVKLLLEINYI